MKHTTRICLVALLFVAALVCGCTQEPSVALPPAKVPEKPTILELKPRVDELLASGDTVMVRRGITDVFALVDLMVEAGRQEDAMYYLSAALKHNAWAMHYQMQYAEMLEAHGETEQARKKASLVLQHAEQDELFYRAQRLVGEGPLPAIPQIETVQNDAATLVLVPVGDVDSCVLHELRREILKRLAIPVLLQDADVNVPHFKRDPVKRHLAEVRASLRKGMKEDIRLASFLRQKGVTEASLQRDDIVVQACRHISFQSGGTNALAQFDAGMRRIERTPKQWDINDLLNNLKAAVCSFRKSNVYFMGIANLDAFADQSNFIFGTAENNGHHAMITYRRFTAYFNGENQNRERLVERILKQTLSSFGFMLGVQRCSTPTCARAYPHNLSEHDAKSTGLCTACRNGFEQALGVAMQKTEKDQQ